MQMTGDWVKGKFLTANKIEDKDFVCMSSTETINQFSCSIDGFVFFRGSDLQKNQAQKVLSKLILKSEFQ
ncbi:hypothetical protein [Candidatus Enterovibrio altilux]|uniref:hypothetical protein n=1 Tax=Candidatus Enterovibrio altilux TaxID=1927128 RepID=UPI000BBCA351|nr:hypothetical protein [Candidatus Enterovibrio luxaltus]